MTTRRYFVKSTLLASTAALAVDTWVLHLRQALAAWPEPAFARTELEHSIAGLTAEKPLIDSADIALKAPDLAENGAVVPIMVTSTLPNIAFIALLGSKNPVPLVAKFDLGPNTEAFVSARMKLAETSDVIVIVNAGDRFYTTRKRVTVTIGGCGA